MWWWHSPSSYDLSMTGSCSLLCLHESTICQLAGCTKNNIYCCCGISPTDHLSTATIDQPTSTRRRNSIGTGGSFICTFTYINLQPSSFSFASPPFRRMKASSWIEMHYSYLTIFHWIQVPAVLCKNRICMTMTGRNAKDILIHICISIHPSLPPKLHASSNSPWISSGVTSPINFTPRFTSCEYLLTRSSTKSNLKSFSYVPFSLEGGGGVEYTTTERHVNKYFKDGDVPAGAWLASIPFWQQPANCFFRCTL